jgi:phage terminase large subunit-like protein
MIFEAGKTDDWHDREVWRRVNPSLGVIKSMAYLEHEHAKACERPSYAATFRRLELNQQTQTKSQWLSLEDWDAMATTKPDFSLLVQTKWFAGLDLATRLDVAAFVLVGDVPTVGLFVMPFFWIPEANAKAREERDRVPYSQWADSGLIKMTEGNVIDLETVANDVVGLAKQFNVSEVAFDPWNATETTRRLAIAGIPLVEFSQGYKTMSPAAKDFERLVVSRKLLHDGHLILRWMAGNVAVKEDLNGNIKPVKERATGRCDGIVALIMGLARQQLQAVAKPKYKGCGIRVL